MRCRERVEIGDHDDYVPCIAVNAHRKHRGEYSTRSGTKVVVTWFGSDGD